MRLSRCHIWWAAAIALSIVLLVAACSSDTAPDAADLSESGARGLAIAQRFNCTGCHTSDGSDSLGPSWLGLYGSEVTFIDGGTAVADDDYLRRAIEDPTAQVVEGYRATMPRQELSAEQLDDVTAYIRELGG
ncbi:MAG: cytochrome c [Actinomycetia bacterium]|nr:cytochrome c [Actinomycetes bacterium]